MAVRLKLEHLDAMKKHAESTYPYECCGLLLGLLVDGEKNLQETYPAANAKEAENQHNRYLIPPQTVLEAEKYARSKRLEIIGFYHSHPEAEARPSLFDLDHAWPFYSYIIVSVKDRMAKDLNSFRMADDRAGFDPEPIITI
jgi:proteasome lid subunit RPN8/RPN11